MAKEYMKQCFRSSFIREIQTKITMRYHYISIRTLKKQKDTEFKTLWNNAVTLYQLAGDLVQF